MTTFELFEKMTELLPKVLNKETTNRVRRGHVHNSLCRLLRISRSNQHVKMIRAVMGANGFREVFIKGSRYYVSYPDANPNKNKVIRKPSDKIA
jgi:hypothetical protein